MQAVLTEPGGMILFSAVPISDPIRAELEADGSVIVEGVAVPEIPERGGYLCIAVDDPKRYLVFEDKDQARAQGYEPTGSPYGLIPSEKRWKSYLKGLKELLAIASQTDETDDDDELWESVMANLRRPEYP
jgi:hypothetical protein